MEFINMPYTTVPLNTHNVQMQYHTVQWEDHFQHLVTTLKDFTMLNIQTDITLVTGDFKVPVHRIMLSCYSSYIKDFLANEAFNCLILIGDIHESLLHVLINFIYTGSASVPISSLNDWYKTTKLLRIQSPEGTEKKECSENLSYQYFTWPQHRESILQHLSQSRNDPIVSDVIFVTNNFTRTFAHSCILSACSRYLLNIFLRHTKRNRKKPYMLVLQNVKSEDLEVVLEFCYRGTVSVHEGNISSVYDTAELLGIQNLCNKLSFLNPMLKTMSEMNAAKYSSDVISRIKAAHYTSEMNGQSPHIQNVFKACLEYENLVDVTLVKDKQSFKAHLLVLSTFSTYFKNLATSLQNDMRDAFILIKDLRTQHLQAFLDYIYKGEAEFPGTTETFCEVMSGWIDFRLLSISESETCQILSNMTSVTKDKTDIGLREVLPEQTNLNIYLPSMYCHVIQPQETESCIQAQITYQNSSCQTEDNMMKLENVEPVEAVPAPSKETLKIEPVSEKLEECNADREKEKDKPLAKDWNTLKNDYDNSTEDDSTEQNPEQDGGEDKTEEDAVDENKSDKKQKEISRTCYTCSETFVTRKQFREHLAFHPMGKIMRCKYCGKGFDRPSQMTLHIRVHTGSKPFSCTQCGSAFAAKSALRKHLEIHAQNKGKTFECAVCNKSFSRKEYLEEHIRTHTGAKPFKCDVCHKSFVGRTGLNHHKKVHEGGDEKKNCVCEICGKSFTRHALWTHVKSHEKSHRCIHCNKNFSTPTALKFHVQGTHLGFREYQCEVCGKKFIQKTHLLRHMKVHDIPKDKRSGFPYLCGKCPRTFKVESKLEIHMKVDHIQPGDRPYSCEICNKRFANRSTVIYHRRSHTGERPHACPTCGKSFMRPDALQHHIASHSGERKHHCTACTKRFASKHSLNKHIMQNHKEKTENSEKQGSSNCEVCHKSIPESQTSVQSRMDRPLQCNVCHKSFRYEDSLNKHLTVHSNQTVQDDSHNNPLSCMYAFQVCGQSFETVPELERPKEGEQSNYANDGLIHSADKPIITESIPPYPFPSTSLTNNTCISNDNRHPIGIPARRPYSITIDGNLCCNDGQNTNVMTDNMTLSLPPPPPLPPPLPVPATFHQLPQSHQALDIHPMVNMAQSHLHDQQIHPHIDMISNSTIPTTSVYTEQLAKPFLYLENINNQVSQDIFRSKLNR